LIKRHIARAAATLCLSAAALPAFAAAGDLASCSTLEDPAERLACYDRLAGRDPGPAKSRSAIAADAAAVPARGPTPAGAGLHAAKDHGFLSRYWELDPDDKRGTFNFTGYHPNFLLPAHYTSHLNGSPSSPTRASVTLPDYRNIEAKLQISLRTKVIQDFGLPDGDLWFGYTQVSLWQVWNKQESAPFRSTDYSPELMYVAPVPEAVRYLPFGWQWRFGQLGLAHQSNGQSDPLSRSWNRVYFGAGFEREDVSFIAHLWRRLSEAPDQDDNPDLTSYIGRGDFTLAWTPGLATTALTYRSTLRSLHRGSLQLDWTYPVRPSQPNGLRWYVQAFSGYGETLLDYNSRQTSLGLGLTLFNF